MTEPPAPFPPGPVPADALRSVVEQATLAPSVHNSQPWRFHLADDLVELHTDPDRAVHVLDPSGRQMVISCGAALFYARLAIEARGRACTVEPAGGDGTLLARLHVGEPATMPPARAALVEAIPSRHTNRSPFDPTPVAAELQTELRRAAEVEGAWLHVVESVDDQLRLTLLLAEADAAQNADPAYREELAEWRRRASAGAEGVPDVAVPGDVRTRGSDFVLRNFNPTEAPPAAGGEPPPTERPLVVVLVTPSDVRGDWLTAGQALAHVLLRATASGVSASPLNQVVDVPAHRAMLRQELRLLGAPQMVLRMGYGAAAAGASRRPVTDVLE